MSSKARITGAAGRRAALAVCAAIVLACAQASTPAAGADRVTAPRSGAKYSGFTVDGRKVTVLISGRAVQLVSFRFKCGRAVGSAALEAIRLRRFDTGYRFRISAHASVSFGGDRSENAPVEIEGRFSRSARSVTGRLRVRASRCDTRYVKWSARR